MDDEYDDPEIIIKSKFKVSKMLEDSQLDFAEEPTQPEMYYVDHMLTLIVYRVELHSQEEVDQKMEQCTVWPPRQCPFCDKEMPGGLPESWRGLWFTQHFSSYACVSCNCMAKSITLRL
jgi:hypothetical protein